MFRKKRQSNQGPEWVRMELLEKHGQYAKTSVIKEGDGTYSILVDGHRSRTGLTRGQADAAADSRIRKLRRNGWRPLTGR